MPDLTSQQGNSPPEEQEPQDPATEKWITQVTQVLGLSPPHPQPAYNNDSWLNAPADGDDLPPDDDDDWLNASAGSADFAADDSWLNAADEGDDTFTEDIDGPDAYQIDTRELKKNAERLGAGAFGEVFKVQQGDKPVAFKVAHTRSAFQALEEEAQIYQKLARAGPHKNVIECYGMQEVDGVKGLAMEYVEGCDASNLLSEAEKLYKSNKLSHSQYWGTVQNMLRDALEGIQHISEAGITHSDIKGGNMLYDKNSQSLKLCDFGRAVTSGEDAARIGTPALTAPEALLNMPYEGTDNTDQAARASEKQDTFSIGQMAYRAGEGQEHLINTQRPNDPSALAYLLTSKLEQMRDGGETRDYRAITPAEDPKEAAKPGHHNASYNTSYAEFVNLATLLESQERGSAKKLLESPFINDPLLQPLEAQKVISGIYEGMTKKD